MTPFSEEVLAHVRVNAPALAEGVLDYRGLLDECGTQFDFFDSRGHLDTVPGPAFAEKARARAGALAARGLVAGDRVLDVADASAGAFGPDPMSVFGDWPAFVDFATEATTGSSARSAATP